MKIIKISEKEFLLKRGDEVLSINTEKKVAGGYYGSSTIPENGVVPNEEWENAKASGAKVEDLESYPILLNLFTEIHNAEVDEEELTLRDELYDWACEHYGCKHAIPERFQVLFAKGSNQ